MGFEKRSPIFVEALSKKDLESLLHQPDPALTVQGLPMNPRISFRKGAHMEDLAKLEQEETSTQSPIDKGMKEILLESKKSLSTQQQLRALAAAAAAATRARAINSPEKV